LHGQWASLQILRVSQSPSSYIIKCLRSGKLNEYHWLGRLPFSVTSETSASQWFQLEVGSNSSHRLFTSMRPALVRSFGLQVHECWIWIPSSDFYHVSLALF
jgi:hypothetical protein